MKSNCKLENITTNNDGSFSFDLYFKPEFDSIDMVEFLKEVFEDEKFNRLTKEQKRDIVEQIILKVINERQKSN